MDALAIATFILAFATVLLVVVEWRGRREQERRRKELAFRAALMEMAENIKSLTSWNPMLVNQRPNESWFNGFTHFDKLYALLDAIWLDTEMWERIIGGLLINIRAYRDRLNNVLSAEWVLVHEEDDKAIEQSKRDYFIVDLYLKQLACYTLSEMRRQGLVVPKDILCSEIFQPLAWLHGDKGKSAETAVLMEQQLTPPFVQLPPEPKDAAFSDCRLEVLIQKAEQKLSDPINKLLSTR